MRLEHGATIDKYVGDAVVAFFGDPETRGIKQDAVACVSMAVAMQRRMRELQREWRDVGYDRPFELRIGINTGYCTVGNFGSEDRMDYTIIGGQVNLASRLQSHAEPGGILISHETYALVKETIRAEEQVPVVVKGLARPVRNYKVVEPVRRAGPAGADPRGTGWAQDGPGPEKARSRSPQSRRSRAPWRGCGVKRHPPSLDADHGPIVVDNHGLISGS